MPLLTNLCRLICFFGCVFPTLVWAHHPGHLRDVQYTESKLALQVSLEHAPYDLGFGKGSWSRTTLETFYRPFRWLGLTSSVPVVRLAPDSADNQMGLGDIEFGVMSPLINNPDSGVYLALGSGIELPTGDDHAGLGGGHIALIPRATLSWLADPNFAIMGDVLYSHTLDGHGHGHAPSPLAVHSQKEVRTQLTFTYMQPSYFMSTGLSLTYGLAGPKELGPVTALAEGGFRFLQSWALIANIEAPVAEAQRFDWRAGLGVRWTLGTPEPAACRCKIPAGSPECQCTSCATGVGCEKPKSN